MAYFPNRTQEFVGNMNAFWQEPAKKDVMGYNLRAVYENQVLVAGDPSVADGDLIPAGTPIQTDEVKKSAKVCRYGYIVAAANDNKTLTMKPNHLLKAGMKVGISGADTAAEYTIASVSGETVVLSSAVSGIKAGDILVEGAVESGVFVPAGVPNRIVVANKVVDELDKAVVGCHEGWALQNVLHYPAEYLNATVAPGTTYLVGCFGLKFMYQ